MSSSIQFVVQDTSNAFIERRKLKLWLCDVVEKEGFILEALSFVLMSDEELLKYNIQYLNHDYYTDVITFDNSEENLTIEGDVLISLDRVRENAKTANSSANKELKRVMVHGLLHLLGYQDSGTAQKNKMRQLEDHYLALYGR